MVLSKLYWTRKMENYMKKLIIIFITSLISVSHANSLKDWTNEDLCRWLDSTSIPQQILNEIDARNAICYVSYETNGLSAQIPYEDKEITALPLPKTRVIRTIKPHTTIPIRFRFNFKFTL